MTPRTSTLQTGPYQIGYGDEGTGPVVMCLHSGGLGSRQWRRLREALVATHRVITPDLLGYGASTAWPADQAFHYQFDVDAMVVLARSFALSPADPLHLVGHSYGGFLACHVARALPAVRSLSVYEPVTFSVLDPDRDADALATLAIKQTWDPDASGVDEAWFASFVDWWNGPGAWAALPPESAASFRAAGWKLFEEVRTLAADPSGPLTFAAITAPALVMGGGASPVAEQRTVQRLAEALPHSELRIFPGLGHMGPITHHALINAAIADHVRAHST